MHILLQQLRHPLLQPPCCALLQQLLDLLLGQPGARAAPAPAAVALGGQLLPDMVSALLECLEQQQGQQGLQGLGQEQGPQGELQQQEEQAAGHAALVQVLLRLSVHAPVALQAALAAADPLPGSQPELAQAAALQAGLRQRLGLAEEVALLAGRAGTMSRTSRARAVVGLHARLEGGWVPGCCCCCYCQWWCCSACHHQCHACVWPGVPLSDMLLLLCLFTMVLALSA